MSLLTNLKDKIKSQIVSQGVSYAKRWVEVIFVDKVYKWLITALLSFSIGILFHDCSKAGDAKKYLAEMQVWKSKADAVQLVNDSLTKEHQRSLKFTDSLINNSKLLDSRIAVLLGQIRSAKKVDDAKLVDLSFTLPDTCKVALDLATSYKVLLEDLSFDVDTINFDRTNLRIVNESLRVDNSRLFLQNHTLDSLIHVVPTYKPPKFLWVIPYPTRKQSFVAGGVLGAGLTFIVIHSLPK